MDVRQAGCADVLKGCEQTKTIENLRIVFGSGRAITKAQVSVIATIDLKIHYAVFLMSAKKSGP